MTDSLRAAAKAGDIKALEALMNQSFGPKGVTVRVTNSETLLKIVVRGKDAPDKALLPTIKRGLAGIRPAGFDQVSVTARVVGKANAWSEQWELTHDTSTESSSVTASSPPPSKPAATVLGGNERETKWYQKSWLVISLLIFFPPGGIALAWVSKWPKAGKIGASIVSGLWLLAILVPQPDEPQSRIAQENTQTPTAELTTESETEAVEELPVSIVVDPEQFFAASQDGDLNVVKAMLSAGISPDTTNKSGSSALAIAASSGNFEVVKAIMAAGPNQSTKDLALLDSAIGPAEITIFLLSNGANPRYTHLSQLDEEKWPVLYTAAQFGTPEHVKALLAAGASWDQLNQQQANDALRSASCNGWPFIVQELLAIGADPNNMNVFEDESPLILASSEVCRMRGSEGQGIAPGARQHNQVVQLLKAAGAK
jgi:hypothetical protein